VDSCLYLFPLLSYLLQFTLIIPQLRGSHISHVEARRGVGESGPFAVPLGGGGGCARGQGGGPALPTERGGTMYVSCTLEYSSML